MFFEVKNLQTNKSKQHLSHFSDSFDSYYSEMIRAEMISGFTPTWYPQRRGVGQHVPGGYGHLVQNCKVKGFRCSRSRVRVQICSGLKDRGCPARSSGTDPSGLVGAELQRIAAGAGCRRKSVEEGLRGSGGTAIFQMAHIHANLARISLRRNPFFYGRTPQT